MGTRRSFPAFAGRGAARHGHPAGRDSLRSPRESGGARGERRPRCPSGRGFQKRGGPSARAPPGQLLRRPASPRPLSPQGGRRGRSGGRGAGRGDPRAREPSSTGSPAPPGAHSPGVRRRAPRALLGVGSRSPKPLSGPAEGQCFPQGHSTRPSRAAAQVSPPPFARPSRRAAPLRKLAGRLHQSLKTGRGAAAAGNGASRPGPASAGGGGDWLRGPRGAGGERGREGPSCARFRRPPRPALRRRGRPGRAR